MSKYDEVLMPFLRMMETELHANAGKGDRPGWLSMSADTCLLEIYYHLGKLQKAVKDGDGDGIKEFTADVANMAMMLADICGALPVQASVKMPDRKDDRKLGQPTMEKWREGWNACLDRFEELNR